nr:hypothetical protein BCU01_20015 [Vibrio splendidus]
MVSLTFELFLGVSFVQKQSEFIVSSFFNNPNDLASFVIITYLSTLLFIIKTEGGFLEYTTLFLVCLVILLVTMSRTALLVFFIVSLLFACSRLKFGFLYLLLGIVAGYLFYSFFLEGILIALIDNSSELVSMNAKRIWLFLFSLDADNSVGAREEIYFAFLSNLHNATLGFGIKNYSEFFSGYNVIELSKVNPHSLLIDFSLSFGYLGAVIYFASPAYMLYLIISKKTDDLSPIFLFCAIFIYFSVSLIPSSIYRLPFFFYPFFLIMFNHTRKVRKKDIW